jgi:hypothetical protein
MRDKETRKQGEKKRKREKEKKRERELINFDSHPCFPLHTRSDIIPINILTLILPRPQTSSRLTFFFLLLHLRLRSMRLLLRPPPYIHQYPGSSQTCAIAPLYPGFLVFVRFTRYSSTLALVVAITSPSWSPVSSPPLYHRHRDPLHRSTPRPGARSASAR